MAAPARVSGTERNIPSSLSATGGELNHGVRGSKVKTKHPLDKSVTRVLADKGSARGATVPGPRAPRAS